MKLLALFALIWCVTLTAFGQITPSDGRDLTPSELTELTTNLEKATPFSQSTLLRMLATQHRPNETSDSPPPGFFWGGEWNPVVVKTYRYRGPGAIGTQFKNIQALVQECEDDKVVDTYGVAFDNVSPSRKTLRITMKGAAKVPKRTLRITFYDPSSKEKATIIRLPTD